MPDVAATEQVPERSIPVVMAELAGETLAFRSSDIEEVVRVVAVSPLPGTPPNIEGVIDVRGELVPVLNLRRRMGYEATPLNLTDRLLLIRAPGRRIAVRVDGVGNVTIMPEAEFLAADGVLTNGSGIAGVFRSDAGLALFADIDAFLTETERLTLQDALAHARNRSA